MSAKITQPPNRKIVRLSWLWRWIRSRLRARSWFGSDDPLIGCAAKPVSPAGSVRESRRAGLRPAPVYRRSLPNPFALRTPPGQRPKSQPKGAERADGGRRPGCGAFAARPVLRRLYIGLVFDFTFARYHVGNQRKEKEPERRKTGRISPLRRRRLRHPCAARRQKHVQPHVDNARQH